MLDSIFRKLPPFKGKNRAARILFNQKIDSSNNVLINGKYSCKYLLPNLQENIGFEIFVNGIYEESTIRFLEKIIPQNGKFIDLGAIIGSIVFRLMKLRPDIDALAVEAAPWIFEYLNKNIALNSIDKAIPCNYALLDNDDVKMNFYSPKGQFGKGSLSPVFVAEPTQVTTRRVDTLIKEYSFDRPTTIKIDVEGFEYFVFKGAENLLRSADRPNIVFEFVDWAENAALGSVGDAQKYLIDIGYKLYILNDGSLSRLHKPLQSGSMNLFASNE